MDNRNDGQQNNHPQSNENTFNHCLKSTVRSINSAGIISEMGTHHCVRKGTESVTREDSTIAR